MESPVFSVRTDVAPEGLGLIEEALQDEVVFAGRPETERLAGPLDPRTVARICVSEP